MPAPFTLRKGDFVISSGRESDEAALEFFLTCVSLERTTLTGKVQFSSPHNEDITYLLNPEEGTTISSITVNGHHTYKYHVRRAAPGFCDISEGPMNQPPREIYRILYHHTLLDRL